MAIKYCKITANLHALVPDTDDPDDFPDRRALSGSIMFEPVINRGELIQHNNAGSLELLALTPIVAEVKIDGRIHYEGNTWVKIPAPTLPDTNVETLQWKATFANFFYDTLSIPINPIIFNAIPDGEINLAAIPTVGGTPTVIIQSGPRGYGVISARNEAGYLVFTFEGPTGEYDSDPISLPGGGGGGEVGGIGDVPGLPEALAAVNARLDTPIPVLVIDTDNVPILDKETWVPCTYTLDGEVIPGDIRGRGNSTWNQPKKPWNMRLTDTTSLLGMTGAKRWSLLANYLDPTGLHNAVAMELGARATGLEWTPEAHHVEVVLNGIPQGLYQLIEPIRMETGRVAGPEATGSTGDALTGNYLLEINNYRDTPVWFDTVHDFLPISMDTPDGTDATDGAAQAAYIEGWFADFENTLYGVDWLDPETGYARFIDRDSFIDWYLVNEVLAGDDSAFQGSVKLVKTRDVAGVPGVLKLGPLWDYDLTLGKAWGATWSAEGWWMRGPTSPLGDTVAGTTWIVRMLDDPDFFDALKLRWAELVAAFAGIDTWIEQQGMRIALPRDRDSTIWDHSVLNRVIAAWRLETAYMKTWLADRIAWITGQLTPDEEAPSIPTGLAAPNITDTTFTITWNAATDNVGVTGYRVLVDSVEYSLPTGTTAVVSGRTPETEYSVTVQARDAAGNWSDESSALLVTTDEAAVGLPARRIAYDWHEGSGATTTPIVGASSQVLTASVPLSAWSGQAAAGEFYGYPLWVSSSETLPEWTAVFDITLSALPGDEASIAQHKSAFLNVGANGRLITYPGDHSSAAGKLAVSTAYRIAWVNTSEGQRVTINGVLEHTSANPVTVVTGDDGFSIVKSGIVGTVDNLDMYAVALTDEQAVEATT